MVATMFKYPGQRGPVQRRDAVAHGQESHEHAGNAVRGLNSPKLRCGSVAGLCFRGFKCVRQEFLSSAFVANALPRCRRQEAYAYDTPHSPVSHTVYAERGPDMQ